MRSINIDEPWRDIWMNLSQHGWKWSVENGNYIYMKPHVSDTKGKKDIDFFHSKKDLLNYIYYIQHQHSSDEKNSTKGGVNKKIKEKVTKETNKTNTNAISSTSSTSAMVAVAGATTSSLALKQATSSTSSDHEDDDDDDDDDDDEPVTEMTIDLELSWKEIWSLLTSECNWSYCSGDLQHNWFYLKSGASKRTGTIGVDYFGETKDVLNYLKTLQIEKENEKLRLLNGTDNDVDEDALRSLSVVLKDATPAPKSGTKNDGSVDGKHSDTMGNVGHVGNVGEDVVYATGMQINAKNTPVAFENYYPSNDQAMDGIETGDEHASIFDTLSHKWIGRREQINELMCHIGSPDDWAVPFVYLYGSTSTGKTSIVHDTLRLLRCRHAYIHCVTVSNQRSLYDQILDQLESSSDGNSTRTFGNNSYGGRDMAEFDDDDDECKSLGYF